MIYRVDDFCETNINPITGIEYDDTWIVFQLVEDVDYNMLCGSFNGCVYSLKVSKSFANWEFSLGDFEGYYSSVEKNIIVVISEEDYIHQKQVYFGHSFDEKYLRDFEKQVLVHSTTKENYERIVNDGCLKCWDILKREIQNYEDEPIGKLLGDPIDLRRFILFGSGTTGEIVVNSKQQNRIVMDENVQYYPGARLYFDMKKIAEAGLMIRDGSEVKVKGILPLKPYLLWVSTCETLGISQISTPKEFAEMSDNYFKKYYNDYIFRIYTR